MAPLWGPLYHIADTKFTLKYSAHNGARTGTGLGRGGIGGLAGFERFQYNSAVGVIFGGGATAAVHAHKRQTVRHRKGLIGGPRQRGGHKFGKNPRSHVAAGAPPQRPRRVIPQINARNQILGKTDEPNIFDIVGGARFTGNGVTGHARLFPGAAFDGAL